MTAAWRLVTHDPHELWSERRRNPALVYALLAHLAVLGVLGIAQLLREAPPPDPPFNFTPIVSIFLPPPPPPPEPPRPLLIPQGDYPVVIPRAAPAPPREAVGPDSVRDLPDTGPPPGIGDFGEGLAPFGELVLPSGVPGGKGRGTGGEGPDDGPDDTGAPLTPGNGVTAPVLIHKVAPLYPNIARLARQEGRVIVEAVIARDGTVEDAEIVHATSRLFEEAALQAVRQWRYEPALLNGRPVRVAFRVNVEFVLQGGD